ncbi:MAG: hypothetical protein EZS28_026538 [Streblomastix strix]|uniref:Uncharacterized protein n=1 Tax=Streblomastix strix TaxID=222440 RepID=A0A5J4V758_9EUKA|nr:MAG: hypothetical protein EZS28_026538 [Streblomastix strix]
MASCANAVKYSIAYNEFKLDGDYSITSFDPSFYLTPQYWKAKVEGLHQTEQIIPQLIVRIMFDNAAYTVTRSKVIVTIKR